MPRLDPTAIAILAAGGVFCVAAIVWAQIFYCRRIRRWAASQGLTLVDWRGAWFFEGPGAPFRSRYKQTFWIEVADRDGLAATGWLTFRWWAFSAEPEVEWN